MTHIIIKQGITKFKHWHSHSPHKQLEIHVHQRKYVKEWVEWVVKPIFYEYIFIVILKFICSSFTNVAHHLSSLHVTEQLKQSILALSTEKTPLCCLPITYFFFLQILHKTSLPPRCSFKK